MTEWPFVDGEMARRVRDHNWSSTPLGPKATWPAALRRATETTLGAPMASVLLWGPEYIIVAYNEGYRAILGEKPDVLGQPVLEVWAEERALLEPQLARILKGETLLFRELPMSLSSAAISNVSWFDYGYGPVRDDDGNVAGLIVSILEVTDRVLAQRAQSDSEERQAFLLKLSDTLRPLADPDDIMAAASEALGRHLGVGRCAYCEVDEACEYYTVFRDWTDGSMPSMVGRHHFGYGDQFREQYRAGRNVLIDDALADARAGNEAGFDAAGGFRAAIGLPLIKEGRFVAGFFVMQLAPRHWRAEDEALMLDVAERTWAAVERARAETALRDSEEEFRRLFASMEQGLCVIEKIDTSPGALSDYRYVAVNPAFSRQTGLPDIIGKRVREVFPGFEQRILDVYDDVIASGYRRQFTDHVAALDIWFEVDAYPGRLPNQVAVLFSNVTIRKRVEAALRRSEERQAFLLNLSDVLRPLSDPMEVMARASEALGRHLGVGRCGYGEVDETGEYFIVERDWTDGHMASFRGTHNFVSFGPEFLEVYRAGRSLLIHDALADTRAEGSEAAFEAAGGVRASLGVPLIKDGRFVAGFFAQQIAPRHWSTEEDALAREVVERTWDAVARARAEAALRESKERLNVALASANLGTFVWHVREDRTEQDARARVHFGLPPDGTVSLAEALMKTFHPEDGARYAAAVARAIDPAGPGTLQEEYRIRLPDGEERWMSTTAIATFEGIPRVATRLTGALADITDRKRAEAALRESEARLAAAFESVPVGVAVIDADGKVVTANQEYRRFLPSGVIPSLDPANGARWRAWDEAGRLIEPQNFPGARALRGERVIPGLEMLYRGEDTQAVWTRVASVPIRDAAGNITTLASVISDINSLKLNAEALRQSEERQAFLLTLSDALRAESGAEAVGNRATQMIADQLRADRVYLVTVDTDDKKVVVTQEARREDMPPLRGVYSGADFPSAFSEIFKRTIVYSDVRSDPRLGEAERLAFAGLSAVSFIAAPIKRGTDDMIWAAGALATEPRSWTPNEITLFEDAVERTWAAVERARAETELRESEERFTQFAKASSAGIWIRDAATLAMEYASPAIGTIYGIERDAILGEVEKWAAIIVPEDRDNALAHIESARQGEPVTHEFRIQRPVDSTFRWIRNTDFPLDQNGHVGRIGGIAEDVTETKLSVEHQAVLLAELQHRVRNIMAIIRSIVARTARGADGVEHYSELLSGRLITLARVQALLTRAANAGVSLVTIVHDELSAQAAHADQFDAIGPDVTLSAKAAETMTLAVHELTTNALKYGALSAPDGRVTVRWTVEEKRGAPWLVFDWNETGAPARPVAAVPRRVGFGSELIEGRIPYELAGHGKVTIDSQGAQCHLEFPLKDGASVLETDAPRRVDIFGGAIDMTGAVDLSGQRVLVVEDDYYLANDTARALKGAGAEVIGPCPSEDAAREMIAETPPTGAILDINLNGGRSFQLAHELSEKGIPFIFVTGYDQEVIAAEYENVPRLQKPVDFKRVVSALTEALS